MGKNVPEIITERIISDLEKGQVPWHRPWKGGGIPRNLVSKQPYHGVNVLLLAWSSYNSPYWLTYKQAMDLGGQVRKGEKGVPIVFFKSVEVDNLDPESDKDKIIIPFLRYYTVFNVEQVDNLPSKMLELFEIVNEKPTIEICEEIWEGYEDKPQLIFQGGRSYYLPPKDTIYLPERKYFDIPEGYYATLFHEMIHSTGHHKRIGRKTFENGNWVSSFKSDYSQEELIAEIGAMFLMGRVGIEDTWDNNMAYIQAWIKNLRNDPNMIIRSASAAQKAHDYILKEGKYVQQTQQITSQ